MSILCFGLFYLSLPLQDKNGLSTALLIVYLDSAFNLPVSTNPMQQPSLLISFFFLDCKLIVLNSLLLIQKNYFEYSNGECGAKKIKNNKYLKVKFIFFSHACK